MIPFNKPYLTGKETRYIEEAVKSGKISGDGEFTMKCHKWFEETYGFSKCLLTTSCTDALEMTSILLDIQPGDEVILPAYTFVSTANAFVLRGAKLVFCDSRPDHPGMDESLLEGLVNENTRAIVVVHYAGVATDMDVVMSLAEKYNLAVVEDAAQAIDSKYKHQYLGGIGTFGTFSFHETKNIMSGEGGLLTINHPEYVGRAEIIREKGTNRSAFFRGEVDKYGWVDIGSSFLPSDVMAAFLYAQIEAKEEIQRRRIEIWNRYKQGLNEFAEAGFLQLPYLPEYATNNAHMFYVVLPSLDERSKLISFLKAKGILSVFHYLSLNKSPFFESSQGTQPSLEQADRYTNCLIRLPLFYELADNQQAYILSAIGEFYHR